MKVEVKCECEKPELLDSVWVQLDSDDHHDPDRGMASKVVGFDEDRIKVAYQTVLGEVLTGWYEKWRVSKYDHVSH